MSAVGSHLPGVLIAGLSLLLVLAAGAKLRRPAVLTEALRGIGVPAAPGVARGVATAETAIAVGGVSLPAPVAATMLAAVFAGLAVAAAVIQGRSGGMGCGCFGERGTRPLGRRHVITTAVLAVCAVAATSAAPSSVMSLVAGSVARGLPVLGAALLVAVALRAWLTGATPDLGSGSLRLVDASARAVEGRFSRRTALARIALGGSALATAPLRYLLYPGSALGVVVPSRCSSGLCTDGYTAFCCEINEGVNGCPEGTFVGGWWMCTDYRGHQLCEGAGRRYYIDCNALPHHPFPGGCRCANDSCEHRRIACNRFRYGQCNTHIKGTTAVVCRVVTCENPGRIRGLGCSTATMVDDAVCGHEAGCLEPAAVQLSGAGGV